MPGGRLLRPDEVAGVLWWLASPDAALLHGAVIDASMGLGVHPGLLSGQNVPPSRSQLGPADRSAA
jgi:NAD(P)-dependent dehydrogenase (short-subunit alcohol dehydrogenase family)